ncbi:RNA 2',3'-cyclic phosphodiesterase [uncultured Paraglaciecola sp.]|uniref:RNA 2',3'-cyclic phosphodiesterase n=1 Tax=uncultured Paraglaciecola sp. TaxID=1765024 RepID=UPI0026088783|nr:RNA 2',3'-cyclic phosphodiesterase [uncultured Paraglaciecola sp.]
MRAFFGLSPDIKTTLEIEAWRSKAFPDFAAPVPGANFHVTLAFLGQVSPTQLDALCENVDAMPEVQAFDVSLNHVGYWAKPKALWLGSHHTHPAHQQLVTHITHSCKMAGLQLTQREYIAHLTLARKCTVNPPAALIEPQFSWHNTEFHLYESVSGKQGVTYPIRHSWSICQSG